MALHLHETTTERFPGLSRRYPIRLSNVRQMQAGKQYKVRVCMFTGNPAFDCLLDCTGQYEGHLRYDRDNGRVFASADEAIYLHVIEEG
ncbi:hypothetical protein JAK47_01830 [Stenotrophomonas maltophilia]|uniref:hypothetical protein n=1 Tax=Stenotrophomonas maltophilia TaxID=40324 RepID=UPI0021CADB2A|nr:hypothetical protein [Stenotrophomonas maltophilia]MCU1053285.1 hypothetical protein [Stenotrophomonas maltophilia]